MIEHTKTDTAAAPATAVPRWLLTLLVAGLVAVLPGLRAGAREAAGAGIAMPSVVVPAPAPEDVRRPSGTGVWHRTGRGLWSRPQLTLTGRRARVAGVLSNPLSESVAGMFTLELLRDGAVVAAARGRVELAPGGRLSYAHTFVIQGWGAGSYSARARMEPADLKRAFAKTGAASRGAAPTGGGR